MGIAAASEQHGYGAGSARDFILVRRAGRNVNACGRDDPVDFAFEDDLPLQAAQVRIRSDETVKLVSIVRMRHLVIGNVLGQIPGFMNGDVNVRVRMRVAVDEDVALHRQYDALRSGRFSSNLPPTIPAAL